MNYRDSLREFSDDELRQEEERLRAVIAPHCGKGATPALLPTEPGPDWPGFGAVA